MKAATAPYTKTYTYNSLGNILTQSNQGSYEYTGASFANPHAATSINGIDQTYDNNGNLIATEDDDW